MLLDGHITSCVPCSTWTTANHSRCVVRDWQVIRKDFSRRNTCLRTRGTADYLFPFLGHLNIRYILILEQKMKSRNQERESIFAYTQPPPQTGVKKGKVHWFNGGRGKKAGFRAGNLLLVKTRPVIWSTEWSRLDRRLSLKFFQACKNAEEILQFTGNRQTCFWKKEKNILSDTVNWATGVERYVETILYFPRYAICQYWS